MNIYVRKRDFGFWTSKPVTVQVKYKGQLIACNHDGYFEDDLPQQRIGSDDTITEWTEKADVCDKCNAWKWAGEEEWRDEPGVRL